jgi:hypothetical protein
MLRSALAKPPAGSRRGLTASRTGGPRGPSSGIGLRSASPLWTMTAVHSDEVCPGPICHAGTVRNMRAKGRSWTTHGKTENRRRYPSAPRLDMPTIRPRRAGRLWTRPESEAPPGLRNDAPQDRGGSPSAGCPGSAASWRSSSLAWASCTGPRTAGLRKPAMLRPVGIVRRSARV